MEKKAEPSVVKSPEEQVPASTGIETLPKKTPIYKSKFFLIFVGVSLLAAFLIGGIMIGRSSSQKETVPIPSAGPDFYKATPTPDYQVSSPTSN